MDPTTFLASLTCKYVEWHNSFAHSKIHLIEKRGKVVSQVYYSRYMLGRKRNRQISILTYVGHLSDLGLVMELGF